MDDHDLTVNVIIAHGLLVDDSWMILSWEIFGLIHEDFSHEIYGLWFIKKYVVKPIL